MRTTKRPRDHSDQIPEGVYSWFRRFMVELDGYLLVEGEQLDESTDPSSYRQAAVRAVLRTLQDSGASMETIRGEIATAVFGHEVSVGPPAWTPEMNERRFQLIDGEIQGRLNPNEQLELEALTQVMRRHLDTEVVMPFSGAQALHRRLIGQEPRASDSVE